MNKVKVNRKKNGLKLLNWNENWKQNKNMNKVKVNRKKNGLKLLNWNENWKWNKNMNKVKVNKMRTVKKEILLVEHLIGTGKRKQKYI